MCLTPTGAAVGVVEYGDDVLRRGLMTAGLVGLLFVGVGWASTVRSRWSAPASLAKDTGNLAAPMAVQVESSQSVAAWASTRGVFAALAGSTGKFRQPQRLSAIGAPLDLAQPLMATDARGDTIVIWQHPYHTTGTLASSFAGSLYASYRPAGGRFGAARLVARGALRAVVGMDGRGDATIVWAQAPGLSGARSIDVIQRAAGGRYGPISVLATGAVALAGGIAVDPAGDAVVVWEAALGSPAIGGLMAATRERGGAFGSPVPIVVPPFSAVGGSVGIDDAGGALIAWDGVHDNGDGLQSESVEVTPLQIGATTAGAAETLQAPGIGTLDGFPLIDVDGAGDAIMTWQTTAHDGRTEKVVVARKVPGRRFGTPVAISTSYSRARGMLMDGGSSFDSAIGPGGEAIIAWGSATEPVHAVLTSSARRPLGHAITLAPAGEDSAVQAVGIGTHRRAITIWSDVDGSRLQYATAR